MLLQTSWLTKVTALERVGAHRQIEVSVVIAVCTGFLSCNTNSCSLSQTTFTSIYYDNLNYFFLNMSVKFSLSKIITVYGKAHPDR